MTYLIDTSGDIEKQLEDVALDAVQEAMVQVDVTFSDDELSQANEEAITWAKDRAAELVGKRVTEDGTVIDNPDAQWAITDGTRELLRADVGTALEEGLSNDSLAKLLSENYAFSDQRASTIARTETGFADVAGNLASYKASGVVSGKQWSASSNCCDECQELDGVVVDLDEEFPDDGGDGPPLHPNCECDILPALAGEDE